MPKRTVNLMVDTVECKSSEGVIVGLIDSILTSATVAASLLREIDPDDITESVSEACNDLFGDKDLRFIISLGGNRNYGDEPSSIEFAKLIEDLKVFAKTKEKP